MRLPLALLAFGLGLATCLSACGNSGNVPALSGRQKRQLRSAAGRLAAQKELRSVLVTEPARSAEEVSAQLDAGELVVAWGAWGEEAWGERGVQESGVRKSMWERVCDGERMQQQ